MQIEIEPQELGYILNEMADKKIKECLPLFMKLSAQLEQHAKAEQLRQQSQQQAQQPTN